MARPGVPPGKTGWRGTLAGEYLAEFLGTFVLIAFGTAVVAMYVAALPLSGRGEGITTDSDWLLITFGWGMAVTFGVYVAGGVTGAHLNPAVSIAFASFGRFPWAKVPGYIVAQVLGAMAGAALVYAVYRDAIQAFESANSITRDGGDGTVGIFVTGPAGYFTDYWGPFLTEVVGTAFLLLIIFAVVDLMNLPPKANLAPLIIGLGVFAIGMSFGANSGYAINPARDFGPRLIAWMMGWGDAAFPGAQGNLDAYWWVPIVAPIIGGVIGAAVYKFFIEDILRARHTPESSGVESKGRVVEDE
ncbi:MAG: MIP/aquaporin family protein [Thermoleophilia bacterium]